MIRYDEIPIIPFPFYFLFFLFIFLPYSPILSLPYPFPPARPRCPQLAPTSRLVRLPHISTPPSPSPAGSPLRARVGYVPFGKTSGEAARGAGPGASPNGAIVLLCDKDRIGSN